MEKGIVIKSTGSWYLVLNGRGETVECRIRGKFRIKKIRTTNPVAVGDCVTIEPSSEGMVIVAIEPRRNYIIRRSTNLSKESHIIASNVDQAILVATLVQPETSTVFIDRFLVTAEAYNIPAVLVFNKIDVCSPDERELLDAYKWMYERVGYRVHLLSAHTQEGLADFRALLQNKTSVFSGISGVGKSSLINRVEPDLGLKTAQISDAHNTGCHTTTFAEMFPLSGGGWIIDTPGVRSFGMIDMQKDELSHYFPEIFRQSANCRFDNCSHLHEPGCAVKAAVESGEISEIRYESYCNIMEELASENEKYR